MVQNAWRGLCEKVPGSVCGGDFSSGVLLLFPNFLFGHYAYLHAPVADFVGMAFK